MSRRQVTTSVLCCAAFCVEAGPRHEVSKKVVDDGQKVRELWILEGVTKQPALLVCQAVHVGALHAAEPLALRPANEFDQFVLSAQCR